MTLISNCVFKQDFKFTLFLHREWRLSLKVYHHLQKHTKKYTYLSIGCFLKKKKDCYLFLIILCTYIVYIDQFHIVLQLLLPNSPHLPSNYMSSTLNPLCSISASSKWEGVSVFTEAWETNHILGKNYSFCLYSSPFQQLLSYR